MIILAVGLLLVNGIDGASSDWDKYYAEMGFNIDVFYALQKDYVLCKSDYKCMESKDKYLNLFHDDCQICLPEKENAIHDTFGCYTKQEYDAWVAGDLTGDVALTSITKWEPTITDITTKQEYNGYDQQTVYIVKMEVYREWNAENLCQYLTHDTEQFEIINGKIRSYQIDIELAGKECPKENENEYATMTNPPTATWKKSTTTSPTPKPTTTTTYKPTFNPTRSPTTPRPTPRPTTPQPTTATPTTATPTTGQPTTSTTSTRPPAPQIITPAPSVWERSTPQPSATSSTRPPAGQILTPPPIIEITTQPPTIQTLTTLKPTSTKVPTPKRCCDKQRSKSWGGRRGLRGGKKNKKGGMNKKGGKKGKKHGMGGSWDSYDYKEQDECDYGYTCMKENRYDECGICIKDYGESQF